MKKIILVVLMLALATPAMATVTITATDEGGGVVRINYNSAGQQLPRAFALNVTVSAGTITAVGNLNTNFWVYPGSIDINDAGEVNNVGSPVCDPCEYPDTLPGLFTNGVTIEMGSLYAATDPCHPTPPPAAGILCKVTVSAACNLTINGNVGRGKVVNEDATAAITNLPIVIAVAQPGCTVPNVVGLTQAAATTAITNAGLVVGTISQVDGGATPIGQVTAQNPGGGGVVTCGTAVNISVAAYCMKSTHPAHTNWVLHGRPKCWCYAKQCRGDTDGLIAGPFWVSLADKTKLVTYLNLYPDPLPDPPIALPAAGACADLDHLKAGLFWVSLADKNILVTYLNQAVVPNCDATHINFWCTPTLVSTGCP